MLIIVASRHDEAAASLAERWKAALLTPRDLSQSGWRYNSAHPEQDQAVAAGRTFANHEITGVLTLLPLVSADELDHIAPDDRSYIAAEMSAFLLAWLSRLTCPVLNQPTPDCLCGPNWRAEKWVRLAARLGIPAAAIRRTTGEDLTEVEEPSCATATVVGQRCFGAVDSTTADHARRIAAAGGADLLGVCFTKPDRGGQLLHVDIRPDISPPGIAECVLKYLHGSRPC